MDTAVLSRILSMYAPNSAGSQEQLVDASLQAIDSLPSLIADLADQARIYETAIDEFSRHTPSPAVDEFGLVFQQSGSDKSTLHDYHKLYATLLHARRHLPCRVVELGIGTNDSTLLSSMGPHGIPGASLRAFESLLPMSEVFGADIDEGILFDAGRIRCVRCDQTRDEGFDELRRVLRDKPVDLVIDDGLHAIHANLRTLLFGLDVVKPGGHVVIEDIPPRVSWFWKIIFPIIQRRSNCALVRCRSALAFVVQV